MTVSQFGFLSATTTVAFSLLLVSALIATAAAADKCGYASCDVGKPNMLNVHIIPHTHDDVGWLKTVDQYYYGNRNNIQNVGIQFILDNAIPELFHDPQKRFIYVEMAYFYRWWNEQPEGSRLRNMTHALVQNGQLQFINGGWCMNDEATTHYTAIVDQHTRGMRFLRENFGDCGLPHVAWQIDPFGHSREQANLFAQMGYDALFFWRLDHQEKDNRLKSKQMEMLWRGSDDLQKSSDLLTSLLYRDYCPPPGFCFDMECADTPIMDDPTLFEYNVQQRVDEFLLYVDGQAKAYNSNHILVPMGCDFQFQNAHMNYKNLDKLIKYVNARQATGTPVNLLYSTPTCYAYALNQANLTYTWKQDDFFPYADKDHAFWTGYFSSRSALKGFVRQSNNLLQATQQLAVLAGLSSDSDDSEVDVLRRAMGVLQHHDAVTGTEKQEVAYDYAMRLNIGTINATRVMSRAVSVLQGLGGDTSTNFVTCLQLNISLCNVMETSGNVLLTVYNPLSHSDTAHVRVPTPCQVEWLLTDAQSGKFVPFDIVPVSARTQSIPERGKSTADCELVFLVSDLPALGYASFSLSRLSREERDFFADYLPAVKKDDNSYFSQAKPTEADPVFIENEFLRADFDPTTQQLVRLTNKVSKTTIALSQSIAYYFSFAGNNANPDSQSSGAYVFRPAAGSQKQTFAAVKIVSLFKGENVQEVHQSFNDTWATQVIRLYKGSRRLEIEWTVGPIPDDGGQGREVIMNYQTDLVTLGAFFTDANGRQLMLRQRDRRPSNPTFQQSEPVSGNYYPVNSRIGLESVNKDVSFMVLNDRSQGGGSVQDGQVELLVHRRTTHDDSYGVGEPLQEKGADGKGLVVRGKHYLLLETTPDMNRLHRLEAFRIFHHPIVLFGANKATSGSSNPRWSGVASEALSPSVRVMTLDNWGGKSKLVRLEHIYQSQEDPTDRSKVQSVNLQSLFIAFNITQATELTLSANQVLSQTRKLQWRSNDNQITPTIPHQQEQLNLRNVTLAPMEIRTFEIVTDQRMQWRR